MNNSFKTLLLISVATAFIPIASAQDKSPAASTEERLQLLEALVKQLRAELEEEKAQTDSDITLLEKKAEAIAPPLAAPDTVPKVAEKPSSGFQVGDTNIKIGGFVDFDTNVSNFSEGFLAGGSAGRDFHIPFTIPVGNTGDGSTVTDFSAQSTRLSVTAARDVAGKKATAYVETDFLLAGNGNERISSSFSPRLRRAYIDYGGWRIGQEWSTFQNTSSIPESASFFVLSDGQVFIRQAQIRYTKGNFQIAAENGNATVIPSGGASPLGVEADSNTLPDLVLRYNLKGSYGNFSLSAIGRQLRISPTLNPLSTDAESDFGWGISASGRINVGKGDIRFGLTGGEGLGRYIGLNLVAGAAINPLTGDVEAIPSIGGHIAYRYPLSDSTRVSFGVSQLSVDNPDFVLGSISDRARSAYGAFFWDVAPKVSVGFEALYGDRRTEDGTDGDLSRFTFSTKYSF